MSFSSTRSWQWGERDAENWAENGFAQIDALSLSCIYYLEAVRRSEARRNDLECSFYYRDCISNSVGESDPEY